MQLNWDDLRIFLAVARQESLSAAARHLRLDPATVGRRVARIEEASAAALFLKSPQGYALTGAGERMLTHAVQAEQVMMSALADTQTRSDRLSGAIRIGAPDGSANYLLPQICAAICDAHPGLEVQIVALPRVFNLSKREADMAITISRPAAGRLTVQRLADYRLHLAGAESYLDRHPPIRTRADLKHHRLIGYIPDLIFDKELDYHDEIGGERARLTSNSFPVQMNWVRAGAGLAVVHDFAMPFVPGLRKVLEDEISLTRSFHLIRHADDHKVSRFNLFAEELSQRLRAEVQRLEALT